MHKYFYNRYKIDLSGKNLKNEDLNNFIRINLENINKLDISNNDITSIRCLYYSNLNN